MLKRQILFILLTIGILGCNTPNKKTASNNNYSDIIVIGAMKDVMWKGELNGSISIDTIAYKKGLYGLGPESYLTGELLINDGIGYVSRVTSDSTMIVEKSYDLRAPFFVYTNVDDWLEINLSTSIKTIKDIEKLINQKTLEFKRPFAFKLKGKVSKAIIHIQNLPRGTIVTSPTEAHEGQTNYELNNEQVEIIGFFSTEHKGIFTHHDSYIHLHLITKDAKKMGHLDELIIDTMKLYLPKK